MKVFHVLLVFIILTAFNACTKTDLNKIPLADAGPAPTIQLPADSVTLTGSGKDEDGSITGYLWSKVSGPTVPSIFTPGEASTKIHDLKAGTYVFQLMVVDNDGATGIDTVSVNVLPSVIQTLTIQPGASDGEDARLTAMQNCTSGNPLNNIGNQNDPDYQDMPIGAWTNNANGCATMQYRAFLKFTALSNIAPTATILSAKLSLYGSTSSLSLPLGNSYYPGSPYNSSGTNDCWLKQVTGNWSESTITWNNQPATNETTRIAIPASTSQWGYNVLDIDVTNMVKDMVNNANSNNGFCIMLQNETYYRSMTFGSSDNVDPAKRPKLVITYQQ
ncbi:MAG: DNRLRE domain-containing protein [Chitinophagaceae bacterium]